MADINVERRDSAPWWMWALGLIIVGLLAFWLATAFGGDEELALEDTAAYPVEPAPEMPAPAAPMDVAPSVQAFIDTCAPAQPQQMGLDHQYTSGCVNQLVTALDETTRDQAATQPAIQQAMAEAREAADNLAQSAQDVEQHSAMTQNAFRSIVAVLGQLQAGSYPALEEELGELSEIASSIDTGQPLLDQRENVQNFFTRAGDALAAIGHSTEPVGV